MNISLLFFRVIAIDQNGMVYVSDCGNHRIQKFFPEGNVLLVFDYDESLLYPNGLCIDSNKIYFMFLTGFVKQRVFIILVDSF